MSANYKIEYTLEQFCLASAVEASVVRELVDQGVLEPAREQTIWYFSEADLNRCMRALRLQRDLEVGLQNLALTLELLDRNQALRNRVEYLEQLFESFERN